MNSTLAVLTASLASAWGQTIPDIKCNTEGEMLLSPQAILLLTPAQAQAVSNAILRHFNIRPQPFNILPDLGDEAMPQTLGSTMRIKPEAWERYLRKNHLSAKKPDPGPQPVEAIEIDGVKLAWPDCWWDPDDVEPA